MKKFLSIIFIIFPLFSYGQIYNSTIYLDKYNDTILENIEKTLIEKTDSTFIISTKGKTPKVYYIINYADYNSIGDKNNIVNLTANVYGYQKSWCVIKSEDKNNYIKTYIEWYNKHSDNLTDPSDLVSALSKYWLFVVHRVITTQYTHTYESEYFWIEDEMCVKLGKNINRIVYKKY